MRVQQISQVKERQVTKKALNSVCFL